MENVRLVGMGLVVAAVVLFIVGFVYVRSAEQAILAGHKTGPGGECLHAEEATCPYQELNALAVPKAVMVGLMLVLAGVGIALFLKKKPSEKVVAQAVSQVKGLEGNERKVADLMCEANGMIFQNELVEKTGFSKVKVTRILDRLEGMGLVERRRRGMTNVVLFKSKN